MRETSKEVPQFATAEFGPGKAQAQVPTDSHAAFVRALAFGAAGAVAGLVLYVAFALLTGLVIGLVSLAVGFIVGKAMIFGSRGVGGRRYQVVAALLTYLAVSMSAVPIAIHQMREHRAHLQSSATAAPRGASVNIPKAIGVLALVGIASPFMELQNPAHGLIGLVILFVGMRFAWRFTAGRTPTPAGLI
jgi:hypothetical protein